jgi:hypothetical protein
MTRPRSAPLVRFEVEDNIRLAIIVCPYCGLEHRHVVPEKILECAPLIRMAKCGGNRDYKLDLHPGAPATQPAAPTGPAFIGGPLEGQVPARRANGKFPAYIDADGEMIPARGHYQSAERDFAAEMPSRWCYRHGRNGVFTWRASAGGGR